MMKDKKSNRGSLTVETVLFLIPFMFAFFTILNAARFVQTEMIIHHAITQTCKEMSTYSYVFTKAGITSKMQEHNAQSHKLHKNIKDTETSVAEFEKAMKNVDIQGMKEAGNATVENAKKLPRKPDEVANEIINELRVGVTAGVNEFIIDSLAKNAVRKSISGYSDDINSYFEDLGVVGGFDGLDFSESKWISNDGGKGNIKIVVKYQMKNQLFPEFDFGIKQCRQSASTLTW